MSTYKLLFAALAVAVVAFLVIVILDLRTTPESPDDPLTAGVGQGEATVRAPEDPRPGPRPRGVTTADAGAATTTTTGGDAAIVRRTDFGAGDPHAWRPEGVPEDVSWDREMRRTRGQLVGEVRRCFRDAAGLDDDASYQVSYRLVVEAGRAHLDDLVVAGAPDDDPVARCISERLGALDWSVDASDFEIPISDSFVVYELME